MKSARDLGVLLASLCALNVQPAAAQCPGQPGPDVARGNRPRLACLDHHYSCETGWSANIDEDSWQWHRLAPWTDRNYTMGVGFARTGAPVIEQGHDFTLRWGDRFVAFVLDNTVFRLPCFRPWRRFDRTLNRDTTEKVYAEMVSGIAFTPESIWAANVQRGDRPYSFTLGWTVRRAAALGDYRDVAITTDLTLGTIGSRLGRNVQRAIHKWRRPVPDCDPADPSTGPCDPKGWANQLYDTPSLWGGVPVVRYGFQVERRLLPLARDSAGRLRRVNTDGTVKHVELVAGAGTELGYYTDIYGSARARVGRFTAPFYAWWQNPLSVGYVLRAQSTTPGERGQPPGAVLTPGPRFELFGYGGIRPRLWAYNLLLQGYPGYPRYALARDSVRTFEYDGEAGVSALLRLGRDRSVAVELTRELIAGKSAEFRTARSRAHAWGGWTASVAWAPHT